MRKEAKDAIVAHFTALFAGDASVVVRALRNLEDPEPPRTEALLAKTHLYLAFPPHREAATCLGGPSVSWRESGAFLVYVLVASQTLDAQADAAFETALDSLRNLTIGGLVDVRNIFGAEAGARFGGNWWGHSAAAEYEVEDI